MHRRIIRWGAIQLVSVFMVMIAIIFLLGEIVTGSAPTAVETLLPDFPVETIQIPVNKDYVVHGWLARGISGHGAILLVHSMRSNRLEMLGRARFLNSQGYHVLMIDLQAHGETPGDRITFGARESVDVAAAVDYLRNTFPHDRIAAIGATLGAAAIVLADPPLRLDAMILESLHPTFAEAVTNRLKLHLGDAGGYLHLLLLPYFSFLLDLQVDQLNPVDRIGNLAIPVLFISGTLDRHTTQSEAKRLYDAAQSPKELWVIEGAGHYNMHSFAGKSYEIRIADFLSTYLQR
ncbi:alpha/beta fold hydrolase [uncultured Nitrosomonas sp.]|uniref:alpha/beta hydrolase n=1 Tax=uncultured Nitrosomonas sp. TaxID=156424 RepID=UPI0026187157|nr:alpha/beta fold hydrolase [uncultured Nitrosomonas sp.]